MGRRRRERRAQGGPDCRMGARARAERTENMLVMVVTLDVSRLSGWLNTDAESNMLCMVVTLDVSRLSGWLNADARCRIERGACDCEAGRERHGPGSRRAVGVGGVSSVYTGESWLEGECRARAYQKHGLHVRDAGRVKAQWLVERGRVLPSRNEGTYDARGGGADRGGGRASELRDGWGEC